MPAHYLPGSGTLLVRAQRWLLLDRPPDQELVALLWEQAATLSVAALADLAAGRASRCVVLDVATGEQAVRGGARVDRSPAWPGARLSLTAGAEPAWAPIEGGVVAASSVYIPVAAAPPAPPHAEPTVPPTHPIPIRFDTAERIERLTPVAERLGPVERTRTIPPPRASSDLLTDTVPYDPDLAGPDPARQHSGITVLAVHCPRGHASPSARATCRQCGVPVRAEEEIRIPRPPLGRLLLPDGRWVMLDRGAVLGRQPAPRSGGDPWPHLVALPSEETRLSRQHAEIELDGWNVLVRDLGSMGGSAIVAPDGTRRRLRPHQAYAWEPDHFLVLSDDFAIRFVVELSGDPT